MKMDNERHKEDFQLVSKDCPWIFISDSKVCICEATKTPCSQDTCALFYFKKFFERRKM
jgi:hypothetical protein